jgi:hypothetical protein
VAVALILRLWHIHHGLPDFLDEALPLRTAFRMSDPVSGAIDWNPHRFHYPSLTFYLHLLVQRVTFAMSVLFDVWTVWSVGRIGERLRPGAGLLAAALAACSGTMILSARLVYTDTIMAAFGLAAFDHLLAWRAHGGKARLLTAVVLLGLSVGSKYPAALLLVPFTAVIVLREGRRALPPALLGAGGAFAVFLVTTPFALLDLKQFLDDFSFVSQLGSAGHLGNYERAGFLFHVRNLMRDLGWVAPVLLAASLPLAIHQARRRLEPAVVWVALLALGLPIALARVEAERYLVPVLPFVAVLIAWAALVLADLARARFRRAVVAGSIAVLVIPALVGGVRAGISLEDATRIEARRWSEANLRSDDVIVQELYGPPLLARSMVRSVHTGRAYAASSPATRRRYDTRAAFRTVILPLVVVGSVDVQVTSKDGKTEWVPVATRSDELNAPLYDPRVFAGVDVVMTSAGVRGRFEATPELYPTQLRFYGLLDSTATLVARFAPHGRSTGPEVRIYRLTDRTRAVIASLGPLPPLWWTSAIAPGFRARFEPTSADTSVSGQPPWIRALATMFYERYRPYTGPAAIELMSVGRLEPARDLSRSTWTMIPQDVEACFVYASALAGLGEWSETVAAIERTFAALPRGQRAPDELRLIHARGLAQLGESARARAELEALARSPQAEIAREARARLEAIGG